MRYIKANVQGKVQGVYFRKATKELALTYEITGWVKNKKDGSVAIEAYGQPDNMERFLSEVEKGPSKKSIVEQMTVTELEGNPAFHTFEIKQ
jgi:acylphosphatase